MKVTFRQLSKRGDDVTIVDTDKVATNDPAALAAIKAAREIFAEVAARSGSAYGISAERGTVRVMEFPSALEYDTVILIPRVVGG